MLLQPAKEKTTHSDEAMGRKESICIIIIILFTETSATVPKNVQREQAVETTEVQQSRGNSRCCVM